MGIVRLGSNSILHVINYYRNMKPGPLTNGSISKELQPFGVRADSKQVDQIRTYVFLLLKWNQAVSLTTVVDPAEIVSRHFGESLFAMNFVDFSHGRLADVGSGGGFPGLPLKIISSDLETTLIEANARKCAFLKEVARTLELNSATIVNERLERFNFRPASFDFVCSRAAGNVEATLGWATSAVRPGGKALLWLGQDDASRISKLPGWKWESPHLIPRSERRVILIGNRQP